MRQAFRSISKVPIVPPLPVGYVTCVKQGNVVPHVIPASRYTPSPLMFKHVEPNIAASGLSIQRLIQQTVLSTRQCYPEEITIVAL